MISEIQRRKWRKSPLFIIYDAKNGPKVVRNAKKYDFGAYSLPKTAKSEAFAALFEK